MIGGGAGAGDAGARRADPRESISWGWRGILDFEAPRRQALGGISAGSAIAAVPLALWFWYDAVATSGWRAARTLIGHARASMVGGNLNWPLHVHPGASWAEVIAVLRRGGID